VSGFRRQEKLLSNASFGVSRSTPFEQCGQLGPGRAFPVVGFPVVRFDLATIIRMPQSTPPWAGELRPDRAKQDEQNLEKCENDFHLKSSRRRRRSNIVHFILRVFAAVKGSFGKTSNPLKAFALGPRFANCCRILFFVNHDLGGRFNHSCVLLDRCSIARIPSLVREGDTELSPSSAPSDALPLRTGARATPMCQSLRSILSSSTDPRNPRVTESRSAESP
jgi:hypothetical protein